MESFKQYLTESTEAEYKIAVDSGNIYTKIYIREPWGTMILNGQKTIETDRNRFPSRLIGVPLYVQNEHKMIGGVITISGSKKYNTPEEFDEDFELHKVPKKSLFHITKRGRTSGWMIDTVKRFDTPIKGAPFRSQYRLQDANI
jgi:hypothetical protein